MNILLFYFYGLAQKHADFIRLIISINIQLTSMLSLKKKKAIARRIDFLRYIPFIRLAVLSGSCATGKAKNESDIDIIIGAKDNRVYLCRAFTLLFCDLFGVRNRPPRSEQNLYYKSDALSEENKLCLSHFAGMSELKMNDPENLYEKESYPYLFPVYGDSSSCASFIQSNAHIIKDIPDYRSSPLFVNKDKRFLAVIFEKALSGKAGDFLESQAADFQIKKIRKYAASLAKDRHKTRVICRQNRIETYYSIF
jgi:predicted nucleotidyltransferase